MFEIEAAQSEDAAQVTACVLTAYDHYDATIGVRPGPMFDDYAVMIRDHSVWVVRDKGAVIAVLVLIDKPEMMLLDNIAVHPDYQGRKLGKKLMAFADVEGVRRGYKAIQLYTHELMAENIAIYEKLGYVEFARKHELGLNRVYLKKLLGDK